MSLQQIDYPDGLMVDTGDGVYYVRGGRKYRVYSPRAVESWRLTPIKGSEQSLSGIPKAKSPLGFRDGTLIHNVADGRMYLISNNKRRQITSPDVFARFGWQVSDCMYVSDAETELHEKGAPIS